VKNDSIEVVRQLQVILSLFLTVTQLWQIYGIWRIYKNINVFATKISKEVKHWGQQGNWTEQ
jgi:Na+-transporting NADH:ubiquinone oxidoreductase subunit NqrD